MTTLMKKEIFEQPNTVDIFYKANNKLVAEIASIVKAKKVNHIIMAARGSSDHACNYFKYLCEIYVGIPVSFAAPSVLTLYNGKLNMANTLVIGVSQSGKAADVLAILEKANEQKAITVTFTNNNSSPMATIAQYHVPLSCGEEKSVAATKSFTAQMFGLLMLANELSGGELKNEVANVVETLNSTLKIIDTCESVAQKFVNFTDTYVLGRGINYASAQETALKVQETTYIKGRAYAVSDFHHGPFAVLDEKTNVILIAPNGVSYKDALEMANKVKPTGAFLTILSDSDEILSLADAKIKMPTVLEAITPFAYVVAMQMFANKLSLARGLNPDAPRGLNKVTITK